MSARVLEFPAPQPLEPAGCPWCDGDSGHELHVIRDVGQDPPVLYAVMCMGCFAIGPSGTSRAEAIACWNSHNHRPAGPGRVA